MSRTILKYLFAFVLLFGQFLNMKAQDIVEEMKIVSIASLVEKYYVEPVSIPENGLNSIDTLFTFLDPHSSYLSPEEFLNSIEKLEGNFEGIGIEYAFIDDTVTVQRVLAGGPSDGTGLMAGDKIVNVDGKSLVSDSLGVNDVKAVLRGPGGSSVMLEVKRRGVAELLPVSIVRGRVPLRSVECSYVTDENILYIKLSRFAQTSLSEIIDAMIRCKSMPKGIILDLRGNSGGYLESASEISNLFLDAGQMIVYSEGYHYPRFDMKADGRGPYKKGKLVLLIDQNSASATEILAGAMQDWDRAILVGRRTYGKGLVQRSFSFTDSSEVRLTVARYHTPSGRMIQTPYNPSHRKDYYRKIEARLKSGELFSKDSIPFPDSLRFSTLTLGRPVYGGGGVSPDVFVPMDTVSYMPFERIIISSGLLTKYTNKYIDSHRDQLQSHAGSFKEMYNYCSSLAGELCGGLLKYVSDDGIRLPEDAVSSQCVYLKTLLKAILVSSSLDTDGYYRVLNIESDPEFKKAVELIVSWPSTFPSLQKPSGKPVRSSDALNN